MRRVSPARSEYIGTALRSCISVSCPQLAPERIWSIPIFSRASLTGATKKSTEVQRKKSSVDRSSSPPISQTTSNGPRVYAPISGFTKFLERGWFSPIEGTLPTEQLHAPDGNARSIHMLLFNRLLDRVDDAIFGRTAQASNLKNRFDLRFLARLQNDFTNPQGPETRGGHNYFICARLQLQYAYASVIGYQGLRFSSCS